MSLLAFTTLVSIFARVTYCSPYSCSRRFNLGCGLPPAEKLSSSGVEYWLKSCKTHGLSEGVARCGLKSVSRKTLLTYQKCWTRFSTWYNQWKINYSRVTVADICDFLFLFNSETPSGGQYSGDALNTFRSAISFFLKLEHPALGYEPSITRMFTSFYKSRPSFPRYVVTWDVGIVLRFLAKWHPPTALTLKQLTLKTVALVALTSSDRAQTLHALKVDRVAATPQGLEFVVYEVLKTYRRGKPARVVKCVSWDKEELDVAFYVQSYIQRTLVLRLRSYKKGLGKPTQLFLSHKSGLPVAKATISRWIKEVLKMSGINTDVFGSHSTRGASTSCLARKGASMVQILSAGDWTNLGTFQRFYDRTMADTPAGRLILEEANVSATIL